MLLAGTTLCWLSMLRQRCAFYQVLPSFFWCRFVPELLHSCYNCLIFVRAFDHIFETIQVSVGIKYLVHASYLEIYNEEIRDLLGKDVKHKLDLKEHPDRGVYVQGMCKSCIFLTFFIRGWPGELPHSQRWGPLESWPIAQPHSLLRLVLYILRAQLSLRVSLARCQRCGPVVQQV